MNPLRRYLAAICFLSLPLVNLNAQTPQTAKTDRIPALSSTIPDALAKGYLGTFGVGLTLQSRTRLTNQFFDPDGNAIATLGLGNPERFIGIDVRVNIYGLGAASGAKGNVGEGTVDVHLSRKINERLWIGAGGYDLVNWNVSDSLSPNLLNSYYGTFTYLFPMTYGGNLPKRRGSITAGFGNGRFRLDGDYDAVHGGGLGIFTSVTIPFMAEGNVIVEWTGYNVFTGVSLFPFRELPGQIVVGIDDLFHKNRRFVVAGSIGLHLIKSEGKSTHGRLTIPSPPPPQTSRT
jgi:hypothetical protein